VTCLCDGVSSIASAVSKLYFNHSRVNTARSVIAATFTSLATTSLHRVVPRRLPMRAVETKDHRSPSQHVPRHGKRLAYHSLGVLVELVQYDASRKCLAWVEATDTHDTP
jgi:hypothetical protein